MKSLLISLMAFLCVLGVNATPSGSGTKEDPYVIADGDTYVVNDIVYASFTAPADGTLSLKHGWSYPTFMLEDGTPLNVSRGVDANFSSLEVEAGKTYVIYNNRQLFFDLEIAVSFEEKGASSLQVVSSEPEQGSKVDKISWDNQVKVTLNKKVKYVHCEFHGDEGIMHQYYTSEAEEGEDVIMVGPEKIVKDDRVLDNAWYMYEGNTYEIIIESYQTKEGMEQGTETPETTTLTFEGGTAKVEKTVVNLVKVEPEPNVVYPTEDQMLSFKDDRKVVTVEVDKKVKVKNCVYPMGMYGTLDWEKAEVSYTEEGHSIIKCTMSEDFYNFMGTIVTDVILQLDLTDEEGNEIEPKAEGFPESVVFGSGYNFTFDVNDGRFADASLNFKSVTPAENSYCTSLGKIEFTYGEKVYTTSTATAAVYKGEEKVADAILTTNEDETGLGLVVTAQFVEIGTQTPKEINEFGAYVLKVDSQSIANEYFNEETPWTDGLQGHGTCNPDFTVAFNIDPAILAVESVDPAPYVEGGEYSKEIPAEINITLSGEGAKVNSALVTYGMNTRVPAEAKVEGKVITVTVPEAALAENNIGVSVAAVNENGTPISYGTDGVILLAYQMPKNILVPTEVTPADGSTVKSIATVELTVDSKYGVGELNTNNVITVKKDGVEASNISAAIDYATGDDMNKMMITFTPEITEDGTYTVVIPEETFYDLDGNLFNPELTYTFIVDNSTNIGGVEVEDANAVVEVYSVDGCLVSKGKKADVMKKLVKGIYIINGQKVVIR
ncbi:hypothetical protein [uncultured Prevotella sp.]|uniref:Ig-like domain-containing protein n=1 Tax=uncultured Prevotella sp. TaxID=159272 RepID=UPI0025F6274D|nr:hypothetical protein [uncultured Prevotella sp.]